MEDRASTHEGDQVRRIDRTPVGLCGVDQLGLPHEARGLPWLRRPVSLTLLEPQCIVRGRHGRQNSERCLMFEIENRLRRLRYEDVAESDFRPA